LDETGIASTSAVALSISELLNEGLLSPLVAAGSVLIAITSIALSRSVLVVINGTWQMALWLGGGLLSMLVAAFLLLFAQLWRWPRSARLPPSGGRFVPPREATRDAGIGQPVIRLITGRSVPTLRRSFSIFTVSRANLQEKSDL
jgi:hypothetical protein